MYFYQLLHYLYTLNLLIQLIWSTKGG